jgi:squalene-hopene/tetraprenyl-beta-curcumene cyclase
MEASFPVPSSMEHGNAVPGLAPAVFGPAGQPELPQTALARALQQSTQWLLERQAADGYWCATLEGDSILESEFILLQAYLDQLSDPRVEQAAQALELSQTAEGGWSMYPGGPLEISASVKAYFALKLCGRNVDAPHMLRARRAIRAAGGADRVNSFTRFYLALLGQLDYKYVPAVPPEAVLLPKWLPINLYRISAWSRTMVVPLAIMWAHRPLRKVPSHRGIEELVLESPDKWPALRSPSLPPEQRFFSWETVFRYADRCAKWLEDRNLRPLRQRALRQAEQWMLDRFVDSDGLGAIFPPIVWSRIALDCLGYAPDSAEVRYCDEQLNVLIYKPRGAQHLRIQPCESPVWDTTIAMRALDAAGVAPADPHLTAATDWLLSKQVTRKGDWAERTKVEPGGWFFEFHNEFYPDIDDTIMALMALRTQLGENSEVQCLRVGSLDAARQSLERHEQIREAAARGVAWTLAMQNRDGGWGAFDRDNDAEFLCAVPFADHNAMIDPSTPDITARVLEALAHWDVQPDHPAVVRALAYIRQTQEADGAWFGRWGVNYIYGTWQVLVGLRAMGVPAEDPAVVKGVQWLEAVQQPCGGWGETAASYDDPGLRGQGPVTASQTAWALLGLLAVHGPERASIRRGVDYLLRTQNSAGTWDETEFTGTGFPRVFYLRYHMYPHYFPMLALGGFARQGTGGPLSPGQAGQAVLQRNVWPRLASRSDDNHLAQQPPTRS